MGGDAEDVALRVELKLVKVLLEDAIKLGFGRWEAGLNSLVVLRRELVID